jgi:hypothetical protein
LLPAEILPLTGVAIDAGTGCLVRQEVSAPIPARDQVRLGRWSCDSSVAKLQLYDIQDLQYGKLIGLSYRHFLVP